MKRSFSPKYSDCPKSIETEAVFTRKEMKNERNIIFSGILPLARKSFISASFFIGRSPSEILLLVWCEAAPYLLLSFRPQMQNYLFIVIIPNSRTDDYTEAKKPNRISIYTEMDKKTFTREIWFQITSILITISHQQLCMFNNRFLINNLQAFKRFVWL